MTVDNHETKVVLIRGYNEHRPECTCGWIGSYWKSHMAAQREADGHVVEDGDR